MTLTKPIINKSGLLKLEMWIWQAKNWKFRETKKELSCAITVSYCWIYWIWRITKGGAKVFNNAGSRLWSMGPSPNFHILLFIPIYDDLSNISQIGVCEKLLKKGLSLQPNFFRNFDFLLRITGNKLHRILSTIFKFHQKIVSFKSYDLLNFLGT